MLVQISNFIPELKDRYFINEKGELFTDYGKTQLKDCVKNGYVKNGLTLKSGKPKHYFRHRLMMLCFNPREDAAELQVNHIDGNKTNNSLENLEWCTNQENRIHAVKLGLAARLKGEQVLDLIVDLLNHVPYSVLTKKYGCSKSTISAIKNKRNWTYLTKDIKFD